MIRRSVPTSECGPLLGLVLLGLAAAGPASAQDTREERWRGDLEYLGTQLEARHPDLYHSLSREAFLLDRQFDRALDRELDCGSSRRRRAGDGE